MITVGSEVLEISEKPTKPPTKQPVLAPGVASPFTLTATTSATSTTTTTAAATTITATASAATCASPKGTTAAKGRRRHSHLTPWIRRQSFLLATMIDDENYNVYESRSFFAEGNYHILSLKECQGFVFNQDLFALPYQQLRSLASERVRTLSYGGGSGCRPGPPRGSLGAPRAPPARRHTTLYHDRRPWLGDVSGSGTGSGTDDTDVVDDFRKSEDIDMSDGDHHPHPNIDSDNHDNDDSDDDDMSDDDDSDGHDYNDGRFRVEVTEVVVGEDDDVIGDLARQHAGQDHGPASYLNR